MQLKSVTELPPLVRGGNRAQSQETKELIEALKTGGVYQLEDIKDQNDFNATQQRIRSAAKLAGIKVTIRNKIEDENSLFFQGLGPVNGSEPVVAEKDSAKASTSTSKTTTK